LAPLLTDTCVTRAKVESSGEQSCLDAPCRRFRPQSPLRTFPKGGRLAAVEFMRQRHKVSRAPREAHPSFGGRRVHLEGGIIRKCSQTCGGPSAFPSLSAGARDLVELLRGSGLWEFFREKVRFHLCTSFVSKSPGKRVC